MFIEVGSYTICSSATMFRLFEVGQIEDGPHHPFSLNSSAFDAASNTASPSISRSITR
jgi:hypothetical protein